LHYATVSKFAQFQVTGLTEVDFRKIRRRWQWALGREFEQEGLIADSRRQAWRDELDGLRAVWGAALARQGVEETIPSNYPDRWWPHRWMNWNTALDVPIPIKHPQFEIGRDNYYRTEQRSLYDAFKWRDEQIQKRLRATKTQCWRIPVTDELETECIETLRRLPSPEKQQLLCKWLSSKRMWRDTPGKPDRKHKRWGVFDSIQALKELPKPDFGIEDEIRRETLKQEKRDEQHDCFIAWSRRAGGRGANARRECAITRKRTA
jgi:hypothetical protein